MKIKDERIVCPHCNANTFEKVYNYTDLYSEEGIIELNCFFCDKDFKVKYTIEIYTEYDKMEGN